MHKASTPSCNAEGCAYLLATTTPWINGGVVAINASGAGVSYLNHVAEREHHRQRGHRYQRCLHHHLQRPFSTIDFRRDSISGITTLPNLSLPYSQLTGTPSTFSYPFPSNATSTKLGLQRRLASRCARRVCGRQQRHAISNRLSSADLPNTALQNSTSPSTASSSTSATRTPSPPLLRRFLATLTRSLTR